MTKIRNAEEAGYKWMVIDGRNEGQGSFDL
jgi:hypothetical protein